jgi:membrane complex biogenesis BtpA family protein
MQTFAVDKPVIGMIHLPPLPGSPAHRLAMDDIRDLMLRDAEALVAGGVDGLMLENFGDAPFYPGRVPPHTVAAIAVLANEVRERFPLPFGINVLRNDGVSALSIAAAVGADYIRINVFTGARVTDQGIIQAEAHEVQRLRRALAASVGIFADVAVKHSAALGDRNLEDEVADTVERARADAIIVSGTATGKPVDLQTVRQAKSAAGLAPVLIGSGVDTENAGELLRYADGLIVGTAFKVDGVTTNPVDVDRVREFMQGLRG